MKKYIISIDQGTSSSRAIVFDKSGNIVSIGQKEHAQIFPKAGWVEHNPKEIWSNIREVVGQSLAKANLNNKDIETVGITNQRETTVFWDKKTGKPFYNAIVWQDTRTQEIVDRLSGKEKNLNIYKDKVGLPLATYFSATKIIWLFENIPGAKKAAEDGNLLFGTMDSWIVWNMTGGVNGGVHITDPTNASRTMLMNINTLQWDEEILKELNIPKKILPKICSSSEIYGICRTTGLLAEVPISGILGDQQAAAFGQVSFYKGEAKNTYGTGSFLLFNTGKEIVKSKNGLITTVAYQLGNNTPVYALEGSIAVTGSLVQWLRDNLGIIEKSSDIEKLASKVPDNGGAYFVPAFSGLFAPYWRSDARGALVGLTRYVNKSHIARAILEASAFQTLEVLEAVQADSGVDLMELRVDGGMASNEMLLQFQADMLNVPIIRPKIIETTALGAAYIAGLAVGYWKDLDDLHSKWVEDKRWLPQISSQKREKEYRNWKKAVTKTFNWIDSDTQ